MRRAGIVLVASALGLAGIIATPSRASASSRQVDYTDYDSEDFRNGSLIDNRYLPLAPGTQLTLEGTVNIDGAPAVHQIVFTVTDLTKTIDGVSSRVIYDVDSTDGVVAEAELAFMAQDDRGNVWNMGEYPEVFDNGVFVGADATWIAGVEDALAGVGMRARPRPGTSEYTQGLIPSIEFHDVAKVVQVLPKLCVPAGCFRDVVVIKETNLYADPTVEGYQLKYYAPNVGNIRIDFTGGVEQETMELVKIKTLKHDALERVRKAAQRLDRRAYRIAPDIYGDTPRASRS